MTPGERTGDDGLTRRDALRATGGLTLAVLAASAAGEPGIAIAVDPDRPAFLAAEEMTTLRALVDTFIPPDGNAGGVQAGCAEAIDGLLGAFSVSPPRIYAGGPFSDRGGFPRNDFARFLKLDAYEERAWRLRIEGSKGRRELERNGPVAGWQVLYRDGLAALSRAGFADMNAVQREMTLRTGGDPTVAALVEVAWPHTWQFFYGAPEYGGNRDRVGWKLAVWDGDVQPRGWTREEVEAGPIPGTTLVVERLPLPFGQVLSLAAFSGSAELVHNLLASTDGTTSALRRAVAPVLERAAEAKQAKESGSGR